MSGIRDFSPRLYQQTILATATKGNTMVILPTGLGKTALAFMLAAQRLSQYPQSKVVFLAPTKPLAEQHLKTMKQHLALAEDDFVLFTGSVSPAKRMQYWKEKRVIISTPQGLENDVISSKIKLTDVSLLIFDEAHRATGDYSYCFLAEQYEKQARFSRVLALTASPGSDLEKITEVCQNLHIEEIEIRTDRDPDVAPYVQKTTVQWMEVEMPAPLKEVHKWLKACFDSKLREIQNYGYVGAAQVRNVSKKQLLGMLSGLHGQISSGNREFELLKSVSLLAEALKVEHALELIETQGVRATYEYMEGLNTQALTSKTKAVQNLVKDVSFRTALLKCRRLIEERFEHPKLTRLKGLLIESIAKNPKQKVILFSHFRDTASHIVDTISKLEGIRPELFVGQAKKKGKGLSQKEQKAVVERFRAGECNILVATSVAEEGLDIPNVDCVMFYEPVASAIRSIQRRGRTGRHEEGQVFVFVTKGTRDQGYRWAAHHKEKRMYRVLDDLKHKLTHAMRKKKQTTAQSSLSAFMATAKDEIKIFADYREKGSPLIKELVSGGITLELCTMHVGDFMLSERVGVEFKNVGDFVDSIVDGRLLDQLKRLQSHYVRPVLIVEGSDDMYAQRNIHPNAIRGMISTITVSYGIPIIQTKNHKDTAAMLAIIAKREQDQMGRSFNPHPMKKQATRKLQQEYVVSAIPGIGPQLAQPLLEKFGTIREFVNASPEELKQVDLIGDKKADAISTLLGHRYGRE